MLSSLTDYLLVSQDRRVIDHCQRQSNHLLLLTACRGLSAVITLTAIDCQLTLTDVYHKLDLSDDAIYSVTMSSLREQGAAYDSLPRPGSPRLTAS